MPEDEAMLALAAAGKEPSDVVGQGGRFACGS